MRKPITRKTGDITTNLRILCILEETGREKTRVYAVEYGCCGEEGKLTGNAIQHRERMNTKVCLDCARAANIGHRPRKNLPPYGITPPTWPVPKL